jgi:hypothetical protein
MLVCEEEQKVIHPDKVADVEFIVRKLLFSELSSLSPMLVVLGAGTKESYFRDFPADRELHRAISLFRMKGHDLKNIVAIDIDPGICKEWAKEGITTVCGDWSTLACLKKVCKVIKDLGGNGFRRMLYANTRGSQKDVSIYDLWIDAIRPQYFIGLYSLRTAFTFESINEHVKSLYKYELYDMGETMNPKQAGLVPYKGLYMSVMRKKWGNRATTYMNYATDGKEEEQ